MVIIFQSKNNELNFTLTEKLITGSAYSNYLFEFNNDTTFQSHWCYANDVSSYPTRFNKFFISESVSPTASSGQVYLQYEGYYHYNIYQNFTNVTESGGNHLLESGKAFIKSSTETPIYYEGNMIPYKVYNPDRNPIVTIFYNFSQSINNFTQSLTNIVNNFTASNNISSSITGSVGRIPKFTNPNSIGNSIMYESGSQIGIDNLNIISNTSYVLVEDSGIVKKISTSSLSVNTSGFVTTSSFNSYTASINAYTASDRLNSASFDSRINLKSDLTLFNSFSQSINSYTASVTRDSASFDTRINNKVDNTVFNNYSQSTNLFTASVTRDSASFNTRINALNIDTSSFVTTSSFKGSPNYLSFFSSSVVLTSSMAYQMFSGSGNLSSSLVLENSNLWFTGSNFSKTRIQKVDNGVEDILSFINAGRAGNGTARFEFLGSANNVDNRFNLLRMNSAIAAHNWTWVIGSAGTNAVATSTHKVTILGNDPNNTMLLLYNNYTGSSDPNTYLRFANTSFGGGGAAVGGFINYKSVSNTLNGDLILGNNDASANLAERNILTLSRFGKVLVGMTSSLFPNSANSASLQVSGNIAGFHIIGTGVTPTIVSGSGAGVTTSTVSITGSDLSGIINLSSGLTPLANGVIATIIYNIPYTGSNTNIALTPANSNTALLSGVNMVYIDSSNINFTINSNASGISPSTSYKWHYIVLQS